METIADSGKLQSVDVMEIQSHPRSLQPDGPGGGFPACILFSAKNDSLSQTTRIKPINNF